MMSLFYKRHRFPPNTIRLAVRLTAPSCVMMVC